MFGYRSPGIEEAAHHRIEFSADDIAPLIALYDMLNDLQAILACEGTEEEKAPFVGIHADLVRLWDGVKLKANPLPVDEIRQNHARMHQLRAGYNAAAKKQRRG